MRDMGSNIFHLDIENNAFDFLELSLELFVQARSTKNQKYWKHALLNIIFCIELLLKERLTREHPILIIQNIDRHRPITRETKTVSWNVAIERLKLVLGEGFEKIDSGRLNLAHKIRNQILHYDVILEFPDAYHTYANLMNFVRGFYSEYLAESEDDLVWKHLNINLHELDEIHDLLDYAFIEEIVFFNGIFMQKYLKEEISEEQGRSTLIINGKEYRRTTYGIDSLDLSADYFEAPCRACSVIKGQYHLYGCDMEWCPKCKKQLITCDCIKDYIFDKESNVLINNKKRLFHRLLKERKINTEQGDN